MKKIFAISVLSVMAVVATTDAWATDATPNYNLATVNYVEDIRDILDANKVSTSYVAESGDWVGDAYKDEYIPTVARMEAAIPDTSGLVDKAQVIKSDDKALSDGATDLSSANADEIVPTFANVEANFAPRIGDSRYYSTPSGSGVEEIGSSLPSGEYSVIVSVDNDGNVSFRWVPIQTTDCSTTAGYTCPPI